MKKCTKCKKTKPKIRFKKDKTRPNGVSSWCKLCHSKSVVKYQQANKSKTVKNKNRYILKSYGLTETDYENMLKEQNNCCLICEKFTENLFIDHCHSTGKVRGLLCRTCNSGIGFLKDDPTIIANALIYLHKFGKEEEKNVFSSGQILGFLLKDFKKLLNN